MMKQKGEVIKINGEQLTQFELQQLETVAAAARVGYDLCKTTTMSREDVGIYVRKAWLESILHVRNKRKS